MAQTYTHTPVLSKVKLGNAIYYLKDADVRAILDTFGNSVTYSVANAIADGNEGLVTSDLVYDFVNRQIGAVGDILNLRSESDHTDIESPSAGDFVVEDDGSEWLYVGSTGGWREIGSEGAYVLKTFTIAGIDMQDNITVAELQTALGLKALAYKDKGTVSISTIDSINNFSTGKAGSYSVSSTPVSVPKTYSSLDVTPAGTVSITPETAAAASYDKTTSVSIATSSPEEGASATYTPSGSVTVTNVTVTPATGSVATVTDNGQAYQLSSGSVSHATDTTSAFATEGIVASIGTDNSATGGEDESETLILTVANTTDAVTAVGAITYTDPTLSGSLPTFGTQSVVTGITSASATASFSGNGVMINATPAYTASSATITQPTYTGSFSGTTKTVTPTVATTENAAGTDGTITVASETITPTFTNSEKTVNVAFSVNS